ncbi:hypothetical protein [Spiroplasma apis]|uniref:Transmembrane protein n=1 Tax=Spiroplasma apis B31 TaxID=1276258 RepID=V5RIW0_SPIAP|nr:hypothetical protein [Spiroplasma apis]AHB36016.1 hypothetical protein SAPIS_v1c01700 [Spiroplasma apis B31]
MKKFSLVKIVITLLSTVFCVILLPFFSINSSLQLVVNNSSISKLTYFILAFGSLNFILSLLIILLQKKNTIILKWFGFLNLLALILALAFQLTFAPTFFSMVSIILIAVDFVVLTSSIYLNFDNNVVSQKVSNEQFLQQETTQPNPNQGNLRVQNQNDEDLKTKINNLKSSLIKSYDEAIEEIEKTGSLNGMDLGDVEINNQNEVPKIEPFVLTESQEVEVKKDTISKREVYEDDVIWDSFKNDDYESISSTSLARKDPLSDGYKFISRRVREESDKH